MDYGFLEWREVILISISWGAIKSNGIFKGVKGHPNPVAQTAKLEGHFSNCSAPNTSGTTSRLSKLKELEESGLITKEEAVEKRKAILDSL